MDQVAGEAATLRDGYMQLHIGYPRRTERVQQAGAGAEKCGPSAGERAQARMYLIHFALWGGLQRELQNSM